MTGRGKFKVEVPLFDSKPHQLFASRSFIRGEVRGALREVALQVDQYTEDQIVASLAEGMEIEFRELGLKVVLL